MANKKPETIKKIKECDVFYVEFYKTTGDTPSLSCLKANGFSRDFIRSTWGGKTSLDSAMADKLSAVRIPEPKRKFKNKPNTDIYIVTGVMNNTRVNKRLMACFETYAKHLGKTQIIGMPIYYRNPTTIDESNKLKKAYWWDDAFTGEFLTDRFELSDNMVLMGHHRIQATATKPLSSLENLSGDMSAVYAHSQCGMLPVANAVNEVTKQLFTTMSCCHKTNYSKTNAGAKAEFHHVPGAQIIEMRDGIPYVMQLIYDGKGFAHLDCYVTPGKVLTGQRVAGIKFGDIHSELADPKVIQKTFVGPNSLMALLKPRVAVFDDLLDFISQNHHNKHNVFLKYLLSVNGRDSVSRGIRDCVDIINLVDDKITDIWITDSNHHDHLTKWLNEADWKKLGPANAKFYINLVSEMLDRIHLTPGFGVGGPSSFEVALKRITNKKLKFMDPNSRNMIGPIDVGQHGDRGANGAKGSISGFSKTGAKLVVGHSHSPGIEKNVFQTGKKCIMQQGYMKGLCSHLHTDVIIYENGKRSLVTFLFNEFRGRLKG